MALHTEGEREGCFEEFEREGDLEPVVIVIVTDLNNRPEYTCYLAIKIHQVLLTLRLFGAQNID
jgi:hypothetical protein